MFPIVSKKKYNDTIFELEVEAPKIAKNALPGQFAVLVAHENGERVPFTLADCNKEKGTVTFVIQVLGKTSSYLLNENLQSIPHITGPLGIPSHIDETKNHIVFIGGGLGIAPLHPIMKAYHQIGKKNTCIVGFRNKNLVFWHDRLSQYASKMLITTDDGSMGEKGLVTDVLEKEISIQKPDLVYAIGPLPMMRAVSEKTQFHGIKTIVSLNPVMVDGIGMCGACRVTIGGVTRYACIEGPEFDASQVDFDELILRSRQFKKEEDICLRDYLKNGIKK
ncbi:MAG: hypothetical protein A2Y41_09850 [Spirochaetes bacterium GWB1_36_13]|nr:MAG: hypothetical protein A2Y41_09850 [Spirochaetes bacterium GWB1_36_13]